MTWSNNSDNATYGYRVYRRGPYNPNIPSISNLSGTIIRSGNFSFTPGLTENSTYYYSISPTGVGGIALPSFISTGIFVGTIDPQVSATSVVSSNSVGLLGTGWYYYGVTIWGPNTNKETTVGGFTSGRFEPKTSSQLTWSLSTGYISGNYGFIPAGFKVYRSRNSSFGSPSLVSIMTGTNVTTFNDVGIAAITGSPPTISKIFSGIDIRLDWTSQSDLRANYPLATDLNNTTAISGFNLINSAPNPPFIPAPFGINGGRQSIGPFVNGKALGEPSTALTEISTYKYFRYSMDVFLSGRPTAAQQIFVGLGPGPLGNPLYRIITGSDFRFNLYFGGQNLFTAATGIINTGTWNTVEMEYLNNVATLYVNNVNVLSQTIVAPTPFSTNVLAFGSNFPSGYLSNIKIRNLSGGGTIQGFKIFRSNNTTYSNNNLIQDINNAPSTSSFLDKGYGQSTGKPIMWEQIADVPYPTNSYVDVGVVKNQLYQYHITSYNFLLIENPA